MSGKTAIYMSINEFVVVDGKALPKHADFFGGHYLYEELPEGVLVLESGACVDQLGKIRDGNGKASRKTNRDALLKKSEEDFW